MPPVTSWGTACSPTTVRATAASAASCSRSSGPGRSPLRAHSCCRRRWRRRTAWRTRASHRAPRAQVDLHLLAMRYTLRFVGRTLFGDDVERLVPVLDAPDTRGRATRSAVAGCRWRRCRWGGLRRATAGHDDCTASCRRWCRRSSPAPPAAASGTAGTTSSAGCTTPPTPPVRCLPPGRPISAVSPVVTAAPVGMGRPGRDGSPLVGTAAPVVHGQLPGGDGSPGGGDCAAGLTAQEVRDQALVFLLAGHETTAVALTATLHLLGPPSGVQDDVAAELDAVLGPGPVRLERPGPAGGDPRCTEEAMRLYPPAYAVDRVHHRTAATRRSPAVPPGTRGGGLPLVDAPAPELLAGPRALRPARFLGRQDRPRYAWFPFGRRPPQLRRRALRRCSRRPSSRPRCCAATRHGTAGTLHVLPRVTLHPVGAVPAVLTAR